jgi:DnaJ-class molecular chaperone
VFVRDGSDIYVDARISFTQAILGGTVEVQTLSGKAQLKVHNVVLSVLYNVWNLVCILD